MLDSRFKSKPSTNFSSNGIQKKTLRIMNSIFIKDVSKKLLKWLLKHAKFINSLALKVIFEKLL